MTRIPATVVIPTRDRPHMLERCLRSVMAAVAPGDEIVVVDSASRDEAVALTAAAAGARVIRCDLPGVDRARNAGWRAAAHDMILFVDDDVTVDRDWANALVLALDAHPEISFVTGRIDVPDHQIGVDRPVATKTEPEPAVLHADTPGTLGHSASLAVRRSALEAVGGFDEMLGAGARFQSAPEVDLFDRLFRSGHIGRYEPAARAWHDQWRGRSDKVRLDWRYGFGDGARIAKLARVEPRKARYLAVDTVLRRGFSGALRDLRAGYELGFVGRVALAIGALAGFVCALPTRIEGGHFVDRRRR